MSVKLQNVNSNLLVLWLLSELVCLLTSCLQMPPSALQMVWVSSTQLGCATAQATTDNGCNEVGQGGGASQVGACVL
jgi:hypothetical protein